MHRVRCALRRDAILILSVGYVGADEVGLKSKQEIQGMLDDPILGDGFEDL